MSTEENNDQVEVVEVAEEIRCGIEKVFEEQLNSKNVDISIEQGSKKGDNYIGVIYRATGKVKVTENGCANPKQMKLIVKVAPQNTTRRELFNARVCFEREIKIYFDVLPMFEQFQESRGIVPEENGFHETPTCFKAIKSFMNESLIFEDLGDFNFQMFDRLAELPIDHVLLVMRTLGKYHALSFALRDQNPELLKKHSALPEIFMKESDPMTQSYFDMMLKNAYDALKDPADERLLGKLKDLLDKDFCSIAYQSVQSAAAEPYAVICHGDCWNNNMLFRYDENGKPIEIRLLDFQVARYASPITDIVYYLFCCTTKHLRDKHYDEILQTYHSSLSQMIERLGSDPEKLFPFDAMLEQFKRFGRYGLTSAIMLLNMLTSPSEDCFDMDELAVSVENGEFQEKTQIPVNSKSFYERIRGVVIDMDRLGYI